MIEKVVILAHGIGTSRKEFLGPTGWGTRFKQFIETRGKGRVLVVPVFWGRLRFFMAGRWMAGYFGRRMKRRAVQRIQRVVAEQAQLHPKAVINFVGHSLGTWLGYRAMFTETAYPKAFFDDVVLMATVVSSRENFVRTAGHFRQLWNLYSKSDEITRFNPYGHAGFRGFLVEGPLGDGKRKVVNIEYPDYEHTDYIYGEKSGANMDFVETLVGVAPPKKEGGNDGKQR